MNSHTLCRGICANPPIKSLRGKLPGSLYWIDPDSTTLQGTRSPVSRWSALGSIYARLRLCTRRLLYAISIPDRLYTLNAIAWLSPPSADSFETVPFHTATI